jgi:hypothetical protein
LGFILHGSAGEQPICLHHGIEVKERIVPHYGVALLHRLHRHLCLMKQVNSVFEITFKKIVRRKKLLLLTVTEIDHVMVLNGGVLKLSDAGVEVLVIEIEQSVIRRMQLFVC